MNNIATISKVIRLYIIHTLFIMKIKINYCSLISLFVLFTFQSLYAQTPINVGPQTATFSSMIRGYHFTAPSTFTICGLYIPDDVSIGFQRVRVVKFNGGAPPAYPRHYK